MKKLGAILLALLLMAGQTAFAEIEPADGGPQAYAAEAVPDGYYVVQELDFEDPALLESDICSTVTTGGRVEISDGRLLLTKTNDAEDSCAVSIYAGGKSNPFALTGDVYVEADLTSLNNNIASNSYFRGKDGGILFGTQFLAGDKFNFSYSQSNPGGSTKWIDETGVTENEVHHILVKVDLGAHRLEFTRDGKQITQGSNVLYTRSSATTAKYFDFSLKGKDGGVSNRGSMAVDNYRVYIPEENRLSMVQEQFSFAMVTEEEPDKLTEDLNLFTDTIAGVKIRWSVDKEGVVDPATGEVLWHSIDNSPEVVLKAEMYFEEDPNTVLAEYSYPIRVPGRDTSAPSFQKTVKSNLLGIPVKNLTDGTLGNGITTGGSESSGWFVIDMEQPVMLSDLTVFEGLVDGSYTVGNISVETSNDQQTWTQVGTAPGIGEKRSIPLLLTEARYIRLNILDKAAGQPMSIQEISVYTDPTDAQRVAADKQWLKSMSFSYEITEDLELPKTGKYGSTITWKSDNPQYVSDDGKFLKRPEGKDQVITLTATITYGEASDQISITHFVKGLYQNTANTGSRPSSGGGSGGSGSGGGGGRSHSTVIAPVAPAGVVTPPVQQELLNGTPTTNDPEQGIVFRDLEQAEWARSYIEALAADQIVTGDGAGAFRPMENVTREEYVKMLVLALGLEPSADSLPFEDCDSAQWYYGYLAAAYQAGLISGVSAERFGIGEPVTRQDVAVITARAAQKFEKSFDKKEYNPFEDAASIADYAKDAVAYLASAGLLSGDGADCFRPMEATSRAAASKLLYLLRNAG